MGTGNGYVFTNHGPSNLVTIDSYNSAWLLDLAKDLPSSFQLDGFDISACGFPQTEWLPRNVSLQALDASKEPPEHLLGKYDIVHLRLFLIVVDGNDPKPFLNHCVKLLSMYGMFFAILGLVEWPTFGIRTRRPVAMGRIRPPNAEDRN